MNHYTTKLLTSFLLRIYIFFFLFHSNYTRDPSLFLSASFFRVTCTRMNSDSVAQLNCLRLVEPYNRAGITHTFNHYTFYHYHHYRHRYHRYYYLLLLVLLHHRLYFISCRPRTDIYMRMAAYTPLNRSNQPRRRARTH